MYCPFCLSVPLCWDGEAGEWIKVAAGRKNKQEKKAEPWSVWGVCISVQQFSMQPCFRRLYLGLLSLLEEKCTACVHVWIMNNGPSSTEHSQQVSSLLHRLASSSENVVSFYLQTLQFSTSSKVLAQFYFNRRPEWAESEFLVLWRVLLQPFKSEHNERSLLTSQNNFSSVIYI